MQRGLGNATKYICSLSSPNTIVFVKNGVSVTYKIWGLHSLEKQFSSSTGNSFTTDTSRNMTVKYIRYTWPMPHCRLSRLQRRICTHKLCDLFSSMSSVILQIMGLSLLYKKNGGWIVLKKRCLHMMLERAFSSTYICQYAVAGCFLYIGNVG